MPQTRLTKGDCENLERLSVKEAKSNLNIKLGQLAGFAVVPQGIPWLAVVTRERARVPRGIPCLCVGLEPELAEVVECALDAGVELCASASGSLAEGDARPQLCRDHACKLFHRRRITQVPA